MDIIKVTPAQQPYETLKENLLSHFKDVRVQEIGEGLHQAGARWQETISHAGHYAGGVSPWQSKYSDVGRIVFLPPDQGAENLVGHMKICQI
jgi:hypothetical protein